MGARQYTQREWKLLSWWLATFHPHAEIHMNLRVGPIVMPANVEAPTAAETRAGRVSQRWLDALFIENGSVNLVEAKIDPDPGIFSQLIHYARRFRADPEWAQYRETPLNLIALVYHDDPSVAMEAPWYGVRWTVYQPVFDGWVPPQLRGNPLLASESPLPQDWPARISLLTGKPLTIPG